MNRAIAAVRQQAALPCSGNSGWDTELHLPLWISRNEVLQVKSRMEGWVEGLLAAHKPGITQLAQVRGGKVGSTKSLKGFGLSA